MSEPAWELLGGGGTVGGPIDYVGDWVSTTTYQPGQVARYAGVDYLCVNPALGQVPPLASPVPAGMVCLFDQVLSAPAASFDVQNISQAYAALRVVVQGRGDSAATALFCQLRFNNDSAANYDSQYMRGSGATYQGAEQLAQTSMIGAAVPGSTAPASLPGSTVIDILNYASTTFFKEAVSVSGYSSGGSTGTYSQTTTGVWKSAAAINRITLFPSAGNFVAGSRVTIYGLLSQGQAPPVTTLAPGGIGTSFPASPANGELFTLVDSLTAPTYAWDFRYVSSISDAYKWVFVGGSPKYLETPGTDTWNLGTVATLPGGPTWLLPRAGNWLFEVDAVGASTTADGQVWLGVGDAATAVSVWIMETFGQQAVAGRWATLHAKGTVNGIAAGVTAAMKVKVNGNGSWQLRRMTIQPMRLA